MTRNTVLSLCDLTGNMVEPWLMAGESLGRQNFRSATPLGFARAVFHANHKE